MIRSFSVYEDVKPKTSQNCVFEFWIFVHDNCDNSNIRQEPSSTTNNVFFRQPKLTGSIEAAVIDGIIVSFCKEFNGAIFFFVKFQNSMYNWNISTFHLKYYNFSHSNI